MAVLDTCETIAAGISIAPTVTCTRPGSTVAPAAASPVTSKVSASPGCGALDALILACDAFCTAVITGGAASIEITTGYALVVPLFSFRIAGPGLTDAGITRLICVAVADRMFTPWPLMVMAVCAPPRFTPDRLAVEPGNTPLAAHTALTSAGSTTGRLALGPPTWKAEGCENTWNPEMTVASDEPWAALGAICTLASACVGLSTHTCRTSTSLEPSPTAVNPSTKCVLLPVMSIMAFAPAGSELGANVTLAATAAG